jgi:hypothetical protein
MGEKHEALAARAECDKLFESRADVLAIWVEGEDCFSLLSYNCLVYKGEEHESPRTHSRSHG